MIGIGAATALGGFLNLLGGVFGNGINALTAQKNIDYQKAANAQNIAFQKQENDITRAREDNAVQRAAADMEAAGLSKTLAAGNPASAQSLSAPQTQALNNSFKYESALQRMNIAQLVQDMAVKNEQLKQSDAKNNAEIALLMAQARGQQLNNETFAERFASEQALRNAQAFSFNAQAKANEASARLNNIIGDYKADEMRSEIFKNVNMGMLYGKEQSKVVSDTLKSIQETKYYKALTERQKKEVDYLVEQITYEQYKITGLKHDLNYAQKYNLPVGSIPGGLLGSGLNFFRSSQGGQNMENSHFFNFLTKPIYKWDWNWLLDLNK